MSLQIRLFAEQDYEAVAAVASAVYEETVSVTGMRWDDENRDPKCKFQRWVAEWEGQVVGSAEYTQNPAFFDPHRFDIGGMVHPKYRGRGIGTALYEAVMAGLASHEVKELTAGTREDFTQGLQFLARRGFTEKMRNWESQLDLTTWNPADWVPAANRALDAGYSVKSWAELGDLPGAKEKLYELVMEVRRDVPSPTPWTDTPYEQWLKLFDNPHFFPEAYCVGIKGDEWVGVSALWHSDDEGILFTGLTATRRQHRGTGITWAMKVHALRYAKEQGYKRVRTWNESNNQKMLAINIKMGFVRKPAWIVHMKQV